MEKSYFVASRVMSRRCVFRNRNSREYLRRALLCFALVCALILTVSCGGNKSDGDSDATGTADFNTNTPGAEAPGTDTENAAANLSLSPLEYPRVDGSTLTIPFSEAVATAVLHLPQDEARLYVMHNKTHQAYLNLIDGVADIIFVTPPSEDELAYAKEKGVVLNVIPMLRDGFVFFVNEKNPVSDLSRDEIVGVYSGKIKNWSEIGGGDAEIIAYQRPENSGSQTGMIELVMKDTPLAPAPQEKVFAEMGGIVDAVAYYENAAEAIGYSYYYYTRNMWGDGQIKYMKIDGVAPSEESIEDDSYPYASITYMVLRQDEPEGSAASRLSEWILSDEGQAVAKGAGYVPIR
jgi:phosphate transport system substrate-binding protein